MSSGAIATGMPYLRLRERPTDLAVQQAAAAVGQSLLIKRYQERLDLFGITAGQVLLTASDIDNPTHRKNAERALETLLSLRILPIVNENDTVATHEIRFGDNDRLAALVARLIRADLLVLLSDVDALYTRPPEEPGAVRIPFVASGDPLTEVVVPSRNRRRHRGSGDEARRRPDGRGRGHRRAAHGDRAGGGRPRRRPRRHLVRARALAPRAARADAPAPEPAGTRRNDAKVGSRA